MTTVIGCDQCRLKECEVEDCRFHVPESSEGDDHSPYCLFHTEAPRFCLRKHCYNEVEPLEKPAHECKMEELLQHCPICKNKYNNPLLKIDDYHYEIFPRQFAPVLKEGRREYLRKKILLELLITRKRDHLLSAVIKNSPLAPLQSYQLLFSNMILYKNHQMAVATTEAQFKLLEKNPKLELIPDCIDQGLLATLMLSVLSIDLAALIIGHPIFDEY